MYQIVVIFFFNDTATTEIYTLSLHDALPISHSWKIDPPPATREAECVRYADRIGYLSHDALDAVRAGVLRVEELPARARAAFGEPGSVMVGAMIDAVVAGSLNDGGKIGRAHV